MKAPYLYLLCPVSAAYGLVQTRSNFYARLNTLNTDSIWKLNKKKAYYPKQNGKLSTTYS